MDIVVKWIVDQCLESAAITGLVDSRVYAAHISAAPQPEYPCLTVWRARPGNVEKYFPYVEFPLVISSYSVNSVDECEALQAAVKSLFHGTINTAGGRSWVIHNTMTPIYSSDKTERLVHALNAVYELAVVG